MKKKFFSKLLTVVLAASMMLTLLPVSAMGWETYDAGDVDVYAASDSFDRILHLDCGRKYFTPDWIKALINEMSAAGYTQLQLAFGNDGLRFLLDDMSFTANGTTYSHETVVSKVEAGNEAQNSSGDSRWLTQSEMDGIIAYAQNRNIEIVPLLNLPGHANAILDIADDAYNASGSNNTLDVASSDEAINFGYAIFQKYVDYFADKGCKYFNFGADEYANDAAGTFSFNRLNSTQYAKFVDFINQLASYIKSKNMTPRSFNDGLYYNGQSASINTDIQCCYWSSGWGSYPVASASTIAGKGHKMINTNGDYYYVLGKDDTFDNGYSSASDFSNTAFMSSTVSDPVGSMFCIWCDYPNAETETEVAQKTRLVLRAMAARMQGKSIDNLDDSVVTGGFNENGTINVPSTETPTTSLSDVCTDGFEPTMTAGGSQTLTLSESATWTTSDADVIALVDADTNGIATYGAPETLTATNVTATAVNAGTATIYATTAGGTTYSSEVTVQDAATGTTTVDVNLEVGKTSTAYTHEGAVTATGNNEYIATVTANTTTTGGTTSYERATLAEGTFYVSTSSSDTNPTMQLTFEAVGDGTYYIKNSSGQYIYPDASYTNIVITSWWSYSLERGSAKAATVTSVGDGYQISRKVESNDKSTVAYLTVESSGSWSNGEWVTTYNFDSTGTATTLYLYKQVTTPGTTSTTLTFTGVGEGNTTVTVGDKKYNITVTAPTTETPVTLNFGKDFTPTGTDITITAGNDIVSLVDGKIVAGTKGGSAKVTSVTKNDGGYVTAHYTYNITVAAEDLSAVTPLTIEYWITNAKVTASGATQMTLKADAANVYSENGAAMSDIVPASGKADNDVEYWKSTRLLSNNKQTTNSGVDKTQSGNDFAYIRYWNGKWSFSADRTTWTDVNSDDQLVAYYMQKTDVTDEVTTYVVDWGTVKNNWNNGLYYLGNKYVLLDYTVKYESGDETPDTFPTAKSLGFHCVTGANETATEYRTLGRIMAKETGDYEVYLITVTPSSDNQNTTLNGSYASANTSYRYQGTEKVAWAATAADYENSSLGKYTSISGSYGYTEGGEPTVSGLEIYRQHAMKVTFYVRAKVTEDSLTVHYIDQASETEFYKYPIVVNSGVLFNENFGLDTNGAVVNGSVVNSLGKTQTVSSDLKTMPAIPAMYRLVDYKCVEANRSGDGKEVYLYYTFDRSVSFVVDFGLPLALKPSDIINGLTTESSIDNVSVTGVSAGTVEIDSNKNVTYKPGVNFLTAGYEQMSFTYTGTISYTDDEGNTKTDTGNVTFVVTILPASNVLYEENFLKVATDKGESYASWTQPSAASTPTQQTQKTGDDSTTYNVFGRDVAYDSSTGNSLGSAWTIANLTSGNGSQYLTTSFYGNGFDLIGTAGPNTGYVYLMIQGDGGNRLKIIDTSYVGGDGNTTLYQVPLAHITGLTEGEYTVYVRAAYRAASGTQAASASTYAMGGSTGAADEIYAMLEELYNDGFDIDDIEFIGFDESAAAVSTYAASSEDSTNTYRPAGDTATIDGFRVYRSTDNASYPDNEKDYMYYNVLDVVDYSINSLVFAEFDSAYELKTRSDYESNGGPQNEIYLTTGQTVVFQTSLTEGTKVQVTARAVENTATNLNGMQIKSNTEMYYVVEVGKNGVIALANMTEKDTSGMLALSNLKVSANTAFNPVTEQSLQTASLMLMSFAADTPVVDDPVEDTPSFKPELKVSERVVNLFRSKLVTLTITTSLDVETLEVNGHYLRPTNSWLVKMGWASSYTYVYVDTLSRGETGEYQITAYDIDGNPYAYYYEA